jgi:hypothetical protein
LDNSAEDIAATANSLYQRRLGRVRFNLPPEAAYLDIDAAIERRGVAAASKIEQLVARQDALRMIEECQKQLVFASAERQEHIVGRKELPARRIEPPAVEDKNAVGWRYSRASGSGSAQDGLDAGE